MEVLITIVEVLITIVGILVLAFLLIMLLDHPTVGPRMRDVLWIMFVLLVILYVLWMLGITEVRLGRIPF